MGHSLLLILTPLYGRSPLKISDHDELEGSFLIDAIELLSKHEAYSQSARKEAGMIKKIESYPEPADPQLQPRGDNAKTPERAEWLRHKLCAEVGDDMF